jgi:hypothetical protein
MYRSGQQFAIVAVFFAVIHLPLCAQPEQVQHVHDSRQTLHSVTLSLTSDALLISSQTQLEDAHGHTFKCTLPASIPFANIVKVVAQPYHGFWFHGHVNELHLEVRENGEKSTYNFVSRTTIRGVRDTWNEGQDGGNQVRTIAARIQTAMATHSDALEARNAERRHAAEEEAKLRAQPSGLISDVQFDDSQSFLPNSRLDAGKKAELVVDVENRGPGTAYQVVISGTANKHAVSVNGQQNLGDIAPGQKREARLSIVAGLDLADGEVTVSVDAREQQRDFKARRVDVIIPTGALKPPHLSIETFVEINDGNTGLAQGNGNKIPENGEKFELTAFVHNEGTAPAMGVVLSPVRLPPGLEPLFPLAAVGTIQPGETKKGKLAFGISRTWSGSSLDIQLKATDVRGEAVGIAFKEFAIKAASHVPVLSASTRVLIHGSATADLSNGQMAEIEVTPQNDGETEANNVFLLVSVPSVAFQSSQIVIGTIRPHEKHLPRRIPFSLPRGFANERLPIMVVLSQNDFDPATVTSEFVVKRRFPDLQAKLMVLESADHLTMEQNQTVTLDLELLNNGTLSAQDVIVGVNVNSPDVKPLGPVKLSLGDIAPSGNAPAQFKFHVGRSVSPGQLAALVSVSQADFLPITQTFQFQVRAEQAQEIRIIPPLPAPGITSRRLPPIVSLPNLHDGDHVHENTIRLVGVIWSDRYINNIEITARGTPIAADRVQESLHRDEQQGRYVIEIDMSIPLDFGANKIELVAYDQDNERGVKSITINRDKPASLEELGTQRLEVIKLRSPNDRSVETSAGIYVGKDKENAYFITALHALQKYADRTVLVETDKLQKQADRIEFVDTVDLQFYTRPTLFPAKILNRFDLGADLAVVYVPLSSLPVEAVPMTLKDATAELPIHIIGHPPAGDWTSWKGAVQNEIAASGNSQLFSTGTDQSLTKGFSGAPVFDAQGHLVGMHLKSSNSFSMNLKIGVILGNLKAWQVPTNNLE